MTDRPIIFSAPMVRALLEGRKTQTRRLLRSPLPAAPDIDAVHPANAGKKLHPVPYFDAYCGAARTALNPRGMTERWCWWTRDDRQCLPTVRIGYVPGDRLWVREAWNLFALSQDAVKSWPVKGAIPRADPRDDDDAVRGHQVVDYATAGLPGTDAGKGPWRPAIYMPRWASRLTLTVSDVRVQRLQEISEADGEAESLWRGRARRHFWWHSPAACRLLQPYRSHKEAFADLWNSIHGPGSWERNPEVVALTFTVERRNIDAA